MQAAHKFDPDREVRFSTYAYMVDTRIHTGLCSAQLVDCPHGTTSAQNRSFQSAPLTRQDRRPHENVGNSLSDEERQEIAKELSVKPADVAVMEARLMAGDQSLNAPLGDEANDDWQSVLADDRPNPEDVVTGMKDGATRSQWLNDALSTLNEREQMIIRERHLQHVVVTLETWPKLGISKERVRQLDHGRWTIKDSMSNHAEDMIGAYI